jgi:C4-dicarboxylate transporter DctM subunit
MTAMFIALVALIVIGVPVSFGIGVACLFGVADLNVPFVVTVQRMFTSLDSYTLMAIPFFILAGNIMEAGGISSRMIDFANKLVGFIRGGLAMVCVVASMLFGCVSGSAAAASAAIGPVVIGGMKKKNYEPEFAAALVAVAGPLGSIIPPSLTMVIYAMASGASVGKMFLAGYVPGLLIGLAMMVLCFVFALKRGYPAEARSSMKELVRSFGRAAWALMTAVIVIAGIMGGIFTATEASVVTVLYAFHGGKIRYQELDVRKLPEIFFKSAVTAATVLFCVATSTILGWLMTRMQIPTLLASWLTTTVGSKIVFLLMLNAIFLVLGCILDASPAILLTVPILLPIATAMGIDPVHFGIITVVNLAVGMSTPPVGITLFVTSSLTEIPVSRMIRHQVPFWGVQIAILLVVTYVPALVMFLPNALM